MRLVDERYRLFGLINPVDLVVLFAILAVAAAAALLLFGAPGKAEQKSATIEFDVLAVRLEEFNPSSLKVGEILTERTAGKLGEIVSIKVEPASLDVVKGDKLVWEQSAVLKNVRIRVRANALVTDAGYVVRGVAIRENTMVNVFTPGFEADHSYVTNVKLVK